MLAMTAEGTPPAEMVETNGVPTIRVNRAAKDFRFGRMDGGGVFTSYFAKTNAAGEVTEISSAAAKITVGNIFSSRVGMRYVPRSEEEGRALAAMAGPEIVREIPAAEVSPLLESWERPRYAVLQAGTLTVRGVFSVSDEFPDRMAALKFFDKTLLKELAGVYGDKLMLHPLGKGEYAFRHDDERGNELEMRIKGFATDGGRIRYFIYHGRPYAPVTSPSAMDARFGSLAPCRRSRD